MKKIVVCLILFSLFTLAKGQYELQFNQLIKSIEFINPGYNAIQRDINGTLIYSNQWNGFPNSPATAAANLHLPLKKKHLGFGLLFTNESLGHRDLRTVGLTIDTDIRLGATSFATVGILGGYQLVDYNIEGATTSYLEALNDIYNFNSTIVGTGLNVFMGRLHVGLSGYYYIKKQEQETVPLNALTLYANTSYWFKLDETWRLKASGLYKTRGKYASIYEGGLFLLYKDLVWIGGSYRHQSAAITMVDLKLSDYFRIGYSYAIGIGKLADFSGDSHEIQVHFSLPSRSDKRND